MVVTLLFPGAQPLAAVGMGVKLFLEVRPPPPPPPLPPAACTSTPNYPVGIQGVDGFIGAEDVDIYVNDVLQVSSATTVFNITSPYLLHLAPGRNEIRFVNKNPNIKNCSTGGTGGQGCLVVSFPNTVNLDRATTIVFGATGGSRTFEVFTPPAVGL